MRTVTQKEMLRILENETYDWPPFVATYGGKTWVHVRTTLAGEKHGLYRTEVEP